MRPEELESFLQAWLEFDSPPSEQDQLRGLLRSGDERTVRELFARPLEFGTAGLRGRVGPGPGAMNTLTVRAFACALARFLATEWGSSRVVLGYDARPESEDYATEIARVLVRHGHFVHWLRPASPTPFVAFLTRTTEARAGVVVTASHNPRGDAGIKIYDSAGIQIVAPWDERISAEMASHDTAAFLSRLQQPEPSTPVGEIVAVDMDALAPYFSWVVGLGKSFVGMERPLQVAYTPLSGVGWGAAQRIAAGLGFSVVAPASEAEPDGSFPHLPKPNPEEPHVLDEVIVVAHEQELDFAVANDPDADRMALALPESIANPRKLERISGDELGLLLADAWLERSNIDRPLLVTTLVSSPALDDLALKYGAEVRRTLTGFKWICRAADDDRFVFAYEEALGYCFARGRERPVLDKDGLAALAVVVGFARELALETGLSPGLALRARLDALAERLGPWVNAQQQVVAGAELGRDELARAVDRLRADPPEKLSGLCVTRFIDYEHGAEARPFYAGRQNLVQFDLEGQGVRARLLVRPSGTEPKLKFYCHVGAVPSSVRAERLSRGALEAWGRRIGQDAVRLLDLSGPTPGAQSRSSAG